MLTLHQGIVVFTVARADCDGLWWLCLDDGWALEREVVSLEPAATAASGAPTDPAEGAAGGGTGGDGRSDRDSPSSIAFTPTATALLVPFHPGTRSYTIMSQRLADAKQKLSTTLTEVLPRLTPTPRSAGTGVHAREGGDPTQTYGYRGHVVRPEDNGDALRRGPRSATAPSGVPGDTFVDDDVGLRRRNRFNVLSPGGDTGRDLEIDLGLGPLGGAMSNFGVPFSGHMGAPVPQRWSTTGGSHTDEMDGYLGPELGRGGATDEDATAIKLRDLQQQLGAMQQSLAQCQRLLGQIASGAHICRAV